MSTVNHYHTTALYRAAQVRELDRLAMKSLGVDGHALMRRAGRAAFDLIRVRWPEARSLSIFCGGGNNGGDGYVVAELARRAGLDVQLVAHRPVEKLTGSAARAANDWLAAGGAVEKPDSAPNGDVVVDALLGTGLEGPVREDCANSIQRINQARRPVMAIDVPSGLNSDTGMVMGACVRANATISFIGRKRGLYTGQAGSYCGQLHFDDLGAPADIYRREKADAVLLDRNQLPVWLPPRRADTHKGDLGRVLIMGGNLGMAGAPVLAGRAALAAGSGLVTLATLAKHLVLAPAIQPELMTADASWPEKVTEHIGKADVVAVGPGLGQDEWSKMLLRACMESSVPLVVDADALNLLARQPRQRDRWILTPHPGEAARLLNTDTASVMADRFAAVRKLAEKYRAVVVLKGHGTLVTAPDEPVAVCPYGSPAMATAGMGDALTGMITSFAGQGLTLPEAARCGVVAHAMAGDSAARDRRQVLASQVIDKLGTILPK